MSCSSATPARKRYERRVLTLMLVYLPTIFLTGRFVRHHALQGWLLYFWSILPAIPVIALIAMMGRYLQEETDEYQRVLTVRALLVATAALLGTLVVDDFLRSFASTAIPPFIGFTIFWLSFAIAIGVQTLRDRAAIHD